MRRLSLDYQSSNEQPWIGWVLLACGIFSVGAVLYSHRARSLELGEWEARLVQAGAKPSSTLRKNSASSDTKQVADETDFANQVAERLTLPWGELFQAVEAASSKEIALLSLQPDPRRRQLRITAETKNLADMLSYLNRLGNNTGLVRVYLVDHQVQLQDPEKPVRFTVQASWSGKL